MLADMKHRLGGQTRPHIMFVFVDGNKVVQSTTEPNERMTTAASMTFQ